MVMNSGSESELSLFCGRLMLEPSKSRLSAHLLYLILTLRKDVSVGGFMKLCGSILHNILFS